jgi:hypothetical protein
MEKINRLTDRIKTEAARQRRLQRNALGEHQDFIAWMHRENAEMLERLIK